VFKLSTSDRSFFDEVDQLVLGPRTAVSERVTTEASGRIEERQQGVEPVDVDTSYNGKAGRMERLGWEF
jgi:hypothetical protein